MDSDFFKKNKNQIFKIAIITIIVLVLYKFITNLSITMATFMNFFRIVKPFVFAGILAYLLYFPCSYVEGKLSKKIKSDVVSRILSITIVYVLFLIFIITLLVYLIPVVFASAIELIKNVPDYIEAFKNMIHNIPDDSFFATFKFDFILNKIDMLTVENLQKELLKYFDINRLLGYTSHIVDIVVSIIQFLMSFIVSIYMLFEREELSKYFKKFLEARTKKKTYLKTLNIIKEGNEIFRKYIVSQFMDALIVGIIMISALLLLKVQYAVLLGFLIGLFNLIPFFGALTAGIVSILLILITGGPEKALRVGIVILILQQIDANIIQPKIVGTQLKVSRILVILSTTLGGAYFGVWGMFFGVPVLTTMKAIVDNITDNKIKDNKVKRLVNKRLLIKVKKPNKNTVKRLRIKNRNKA